MLVGTVSSGNGTYLSQTPRKNVTFSGRVRPHLCVLCTAQFERAVRRERRVCCWFSLSTRLSPAQARNLDSTRLALPVTLGTCCLAGRSSIQVCCSASCSWLRAACAAKTASHSTAGSLFARRYQRLFVFPAAIAPCAESAAKLAKLGVSGRPLGLISSK